MDDPRKKDGLLTRIGQALTWFALVGPRMAAVARVYERPEADFERRGTTRDAQARRILG